MSEARRKIDEVKQNFHESIDAGSSNDVLHEMVENMFVLSETLSDILQRVSDIEESLSDLDAYGKK